jgi:hypothetical protein
MIIAFALIAFPVMAGGSGEKSGSGGKAAATAQPGNSRENAVLLALPNNSNTFSGVISKPSDSGEYTCWYKIAGTGTEIRVYSTNLKSGDPAVYVYEDWGAEGANPMNLANHDDVDDSSNFDLTFKTETGTNYDICIQAYGDDDAVFDLVIVKNP